MIAAFFGGMVALFAPCCISVMLPAYLATGLHQRRQLVGMTFVFAGGVAAVILPISFGATALSRLINGQHFVVYSVMAVVMLVMGAAMALGFKLPIPMIGMRPTQSAGAGRAFVLGVISGVATACCAPVLAGVIALSGAAANFVTALAIGAAYVFGMVAPLFAIATVWDRRHQSGRPRRASRSVTLRLGGGKRTIPMPALLGGLLLITMGLLVAVLAETGPNMATTGWQATVASKLQHAAHVLTVWFGHVPGWVMVLVLVSALAMLARYAVHQMADRDPRLGTSDMDDLPGDGSEYSKEDDTVAPLASHVELTLNPLDLRAAADLSHSNPDPEPATHLGR